MLVESVQVNSFHVDHASESYSIPLAAWKILLVVLEK